MASKNCTETEEITTLTDRLEGLTKDLQGTIGKFRI